MPVFPEVVLTTEPSIGKGAGFVFYYSVIASPAGDCFIVACEHGIVFLGFPAAGSSGNLLAGLQQQWPAALWVADHGVIGALGRKVFAPEPRESVHLLVQGTPFQLQVWEALSGVPSGQVVTYGELAGRIGRPTASRAVGSAVGKNPVSYLIPCHRVLPRAGGVGNYLWGSLCKQALLQREGISVPLSPGLAGNGQ